MSNLRKKILARHVQVAIESADAAVVEEKVDAPTEEEAAEAAAAAAAASAVVVDEPAVVQAAPETVIEVVDPMAEEVAEVIEASDEVEDLEDEQEQVEEAVEGLEAIALSMEATLASGGMNPQSALFAKIAIESYLSPLGVTAPIASVESFGSTATKLGQTQVSIESLKENIKKLWDFILGILEKMRTAVTKFYQKVFAVAPRLLAKAEGISKRADAITTNPKEAKVKVGSSLVSKLRVGNTLPASLPTELKKLSDVSDVLFTKYTPAAITWGEGVLKAIEAVKVSSDSDFEGSLKAIGSVKPLSVDGLATKDVSKTDKRFSNLGAGTSVASGNELLGGKAIFHQVAPSTEGDVQSILSAIKASSYSLGDASGEKADVKEQEVDVLNKADIKALADGVAEIAKAIVAFKKDTDAADKVKDEAKKAGGKLAKDLSASDKLNAKNGSLATAIVKSVQSIPVVVDQPNQRFTQYVLSTAGSVLSLCEKSLSQY